MGSRQYSRKRRKQNGGEVLKEQFPMYDINYLVECSGNILLVTRYIAPHATDDGTLLEPN